MESNEAKSRTQTNTTTPHQISDFGGAKYTYRGHDVNPFGSITITEGYIAPEIDYDEIGSQPYPVAAEQQLAACNIWQIGRTLLSLMLLDKSRDVASEQVKYHNTVDENDPDLVPDEWKYDFDGLKALGGNGYSDALIDTVEGCMEPIIANRFSPGELLNYVLIKGMPAPNESAKEKFEDRLRLVLSKKNRYAAGLSGGKAA